MMKKEKLLFTLSLIFATLGLILIVFGFFYLGNLSKTDYYLILISFFLFISMFTFLIKNKVSKNSAYEEPQELEDEDSAYEEPQELEDEDSAYEEPQELEDEDSAYEEPQELEDEDSAYEEPQKAEGEIDIITPKIPAQMDKFLKEKDMSNYEKKLKILSEFYESQKTDNDISDNLSQLQTLANADDEYKALFGAVLLGNWEVRGVYVNVGKPVGKSLFLRKEDDTLDFVEDKEQATIFEDEELGTLPKIYQQSDYYEKG